MKYSIKRLASGIIQINLTVGLVLYFVTLYLMQYSTLPIVELDDLNLYIYLASTTTLFSIIIALFSALPLIVLMLKYKYFSLFSSSLAFGIPVFVIFLIEPVTFHQIAIYINLAIGLAFYYFVSREYGASNKPLNRDK